MSQQLSAGTFQQVANTSQFSKNNQDSEVCILEVNIQNPAKLHDLHNDLFYLLKRMKTEKLKSLHLTCMVKKIYYANKKLAKEALNHEIFLKKVHRVIKFNQEGWLEPHINEKDPKNYFQKYLFNLMNTDFGKAMENVIKHRDIKFVTTNKRRNYLVLEPDYHTKKSF